MEVTHAEKQTTHVVLSPQKSIAVSMVDTPELMHLLSGALYKNPTYAMVREVLCNAYDAHIEAGIADTPIKVTVTDDELIIQDFGMGIPKDLIGEIYGTYGLSSKKKKKNQTGGFGFGSKSPWSYTDIFKVTSCHNGVKTLYRMVKIDPNNNGKPGIIPVLDLATEESGLTVAIPVKPGNKSTIIGYLQKLSMLGGMPVLCNDELLPTLPYNKVKHNFMIVKNSEVHISAINVKYGAVVYPIERAEKYGTEFDQVVKLINKFRKDYYGGINQLILFAEADSLSLAPSRDNLTLDPKTEEKITTLLQNFLQFLQTVNEEAIKRQYYVEAVKEMVRKEGTYLFSSPLSSQFTCTSVYRKAEKMPVLLTCQDLGRATPDQTRRHGMEDTLLKYAFRYLNQGDKPDLAMRRFMQKQYHKVPHATAVAHLTARRAYLNLRVLIKDVEATTYFYHPLKRTPFRITEGEHLSYGLSFVNKHVVVTTKAGKLDERLVYLDEVPNLYGTFVLVVRKNQQAINSLVGLLKSKGYKVTDLASEIDMPRHVEAQKQLKAERAVAPPKTKTEEGYLPLRACFNDYSDSSFDHRKGEGWEKEDAPCAYIKLGRSLEDNSNTLSYTLCNLGHYQRKYALQEIDKGIVIAFTQKEKTALIKAGVPALTEYLTTYLVQYFKENRKLVIQYLRQEALKKNTDARKLFEYTYVAEKLGVCQSIPHVLPLLHQVVLNHERGEFSDEQNKVLAALKAQYENIEPTAQMVKRLNKVLENPFFGFLDLEEINRTLRLPSDSPEHIHATQLLKRII